MLTGVYQLGEYLGESTGIQGGELEGVVENPNEKGSLKHVIKIIFDEDGRFLEEIAYEEFSERRIERYAYKKGVGARGGDVTPVSKLTEPSKTVAKIKAALKDLVAGASKGKEREMFAAILSCFDENASQLVKHVEKKLASMAFGKRDSALLTVAVRHGDSEKYMGDYAVVKERLLKMYDEQYFDRYGKVSRGQGICYYCGRRTEVYGFVNTYNSYTVDKIGFVSGGFRQELAWKNYPVCSRCSHTLERGKRYITANLTSRFSGFNYSVIPKITFKDNEQQNIISEIIEDFERHKFSLSQKENLLASEDEFIEVMANSGNSMNYNLLIFKEEQSGKVFRILLYIEDIVPSRLKRILRVKDRVEEIELFKNLPGKDKTTYSMPFSFERIRRFLPNTRIEGSFDKSFLEVLDNIFSHKKISYKFLLGRMTEKIRSAFSSGQYIDVLVLEALISIMFIQMLGLFSDREDGRSCAMAEKNEKNAEYLVFFETHSGVFDSDYRKAVFLTGVLADKLMSIQYKERSSKPFYSRLNGLKLNDGLIKRIYREAVNKLEEYKKNYYRELELLICEFMLEPQSISDDDISFYFTMGMTMSKKFQKEKKEEGKDD